ncbi:MAG: GntR family transcriptional regulator [Clostridiales bacterium]|nr:GntR family transcriptional regulator [Clostridiales bacterium]
MKWKFSGDRTIYIQIVEQVKLFILSGELSPGSRLPSVRELAAEAGVNPNTMQRALCELETTGLLISQRTAGRFITEDKELILRLKRETTLKKTAGFIRDMSEIGYTAEEAVDFINIFLKRGEEV